jgi:hypothetical protein
MTDETIGGFVTRYLMVSGNAKQKEVSRSIFTAVTGQWRIFPYLDDNLQKFFKHNFFGETSADIVTNNTLVPLYQLSGNSNFSEIYKNLLLLQECNDDYDYFELEVASKSETMTVDIKYCPHCFSEQIRTQGFSWFRRLWLVPGLNFCESHNYRLINLTQQSRDTYKIGIDIAISALEASPQKNRCTKTTLLYKEKNPYYSWVKNIIRENLPPFSPRLRIFLLQHSCLRLGGDRSWTVSRMADLLSHTYYSEEHPWHNSDEQKQDPFKAVIYKRCMTDALSWGGKGGNFYPHSYVTPSACLLYPLSWVFPNFDDFIVFLEKVSFKKNNSTASGKTFLTLDLKNDFYIIQQDA